MSVKVNPPPAVRIPDKFFNDPETRSFFEQWRQILFQLWQRTGGPVDIISDVESSLDYSESIYGGTEDGDSEGFGEETGAQVSELEEENYTEQTVIPRHEFRSISVNTNTDAIAFDFIAVTEQATIKLPQYPDRDDVVTVLNANGSEVTVDGNGVLINGESTTISYRKNTTINYHYFADLGAWYMR